MKAPDRTRRFAAQMFAAAAALRRVQARLVQLVRQDHSAIVGQRETAVIQAQGRTVAAALKTLAERYDIAD
jgi:hypothetical protein